MPDRSAAPLPRDAATAWMMTMVEPLLSEQRRVALEQDMIRAARSHPAWSASWFGGVLSDLIQTLPPDDPWRHLSARIGRLTVTPTDDGEAPAEIGAVHTVGDRLGSWFGYPEDGMDLIPAAFDNPANDAALAALVEPLPSASAAMIAFAAAGWKAGVDAAKQVYRASVPGAGEQSTNVGVIYPDEFRSGIAGAELHRCGAAALRWATWRRRAYFGGAGGDDAWPVESAFRWGHRANRMILSEPWDEDEVARGIEGHQLPLGRGDSNDF